MKIIATFAVLLLIVTYACETEFFETNVVVDTTWENNTYEATIEYAKDWYEKNKPEELVFRASNGKEKEKIQMKPEWKQAFANKNAKYEVVETDLAIQGIYRYIDKDCMKKYKETNDEKYKQSYSRLVLRTDKKTKETVGFLITIVPNLEFLEKSKFKPFKKVCYIDRGKDFGGVILFHNMDGSFANGWVYEQGKVTGSINALEEAPVEISLRSTYCFRVDWYFEWTQCTDWYSGSEEYGFKYTGTTCKSWWEYGYSYWYCIDYEDDEPGEYCFYCGGGDGGTGISTVSPSYNLLNIINKHSLTSTQINLLNEAIDKIMKNCIYNDLYYYITNKGVKFKDVKIDPSIPPGSAGYDPFSGNLVFYSAEQINSNFLGAELVHLFQDAFYGNSNMQNYYHSSKGNIEFEARLIMDLMCHITKPSGCQYFAEGNNYGYYYPKWIEYLTNGGTRFPSYMEIFFMKKDGFGYWDFLYDFAISNSYKFDLFLNPFAFASINNINVNNCLK